jgi:dsDNA-binding SOS-regulon protein
MNAIQEVVHLMNDEDIKAFSLYLDKKNKRKDVRNTELFELLKTDDINVEKKAFQDKKSADAYHALRKRLYDTLVEFMANRSFENDTSQEHAIVRLLVVSRLFFEHKLTKAAFKCLAKAEAIAVEIEHFSLLNEIYHTQIQFAHLNLALALDEVVAKFSANKKKLEQEEQLNLGYALLRRELAQVYHEGKIVNFQELIKNTITTHGISLRQVLTFKSLYQILFIANEYASINSDYGLIAPFIAKSYRFITGNAALADRHLYYHIYILYFMANFHFRNGRFAESQEYLEKMREQLQKQGGKYYNRFCLRYFLLKALNENYSGNPGKATDTAEKALAQHKKADANDINDLRLLLIVIYLQQDAGRDAAKEMVKLGHSDSWYEKKMGMDWAIKKCLVEILLHTQQEHIELALSRIKSFKRRYKKYLITVNEERVVHYLSLIERYVLKPEIATAPKFKNTVEEFIGQAQSGPQDIFVMSFLAWLLARVNRKPVYDTTLKLLEHYFSPSHSA